MSTKREKLKFGLWKKITGKAVDELAEYTSQQLDAIRGELAGLGPSIDRTKNELASKIEEEFGKASAKTEQIEKQLGERVTRLEGSLKEARELVGELSALRSRMDETISRLQVAAKAKPVAARELPELVLKKPAEKMPAEAVAVVAARAGIGVRGHIKVGIQVRRPTLERFLEANASSAKSEDNAVHWAYIDEKVNLLHQATLSEGKLDRIDFDWTVTDPRGFEPDKFVLSRTRLLMGMFSKNEVFGEAVGVDRAWASRALPWLINWAVQRGATTRGEIRDKLGSLGLRGVNRDLGLEEELKRRAGIEVRKRARFKRDYFSQALSQPELCGVKLEDGKYVLVEKLIEWETIER